MIASGNWLGEASSPSITNKPICANQLTDSVNPSVAEWWGRAWLPSHKPAM